MIKLAYSISTGCYDISADAGIATDDGLTTGILLSLLTDAETGKQGWWGAEFSRAGRPWGSTLRRVIREAPGADVAARVRESAESALAWIVDEGYAASVSADVEVSDGAVLLRITLIKPDGTPGSELWEVTINGL